MGFGKCGEWLSRVNLFDYRNINKLVRSSFAHSVMFASGVVLVGVSVPFLLRSNYWESRYQIMQSIRTLIAETEVLQSLDQIEDSTPDGTDEQNLINNKLADIYGRSQLLFGLDDDTYINFDNLDGLLSSDEFRFGLARLEDFINRQRRGLYFYLGYSILGIGILFILTSLVLIVFQIRLSWQAEVDASARKSNAAQKKVRENQDEAAVPAWNMARATLEEYYNRNLYEVRMIFLASVVAMIAGFVLILGCIIYGFIRQSSERLASVPSINIVLQESTNSNIQIPQESIASSSEGDTEPEQSQENDIVVIGIVAGVITNFIGATFLFLYQSTIRQASTYAQSLERINSVGMSMYILDSLPKQPYDSDTQKQIIEAKVSIAKLLIPGSSSVEDNESLKREKNNGLSSDKNVN